MSATPTGSIAGGLLRSVPVILALSCAPSAERTVPPNQLFDPEGNFPQLIELRAVDDDWESRLLQDGEMRPRSVREEGGETFVTLFTTGRHAMHMHLYGLAPVEHDIDIGRITQAAGGGACPPSATYFKSYNDIVSEMNALAATPGVYSFAFGNPTVDGNSLHAIQFGPYQAGASTVPAMIIVGTIHAREWMSTALSLGIMRDLEAVLAGGGAYRPAVYAALAEAAVVVVPVMNPDGYEYTRDPDGERTFRGNRNNLCVPNGFGTDLNRNFPLAWEPNADCVESNPGQMPPNSEVETQAMMGLMDGGQFHVEANPIDPLVLVDYHAFATDVRITNGWKEASDSDGPECAAGAGTFPQFCSNPDIQLFHYVFSDPGFSGWYDTFTNPDSLMPFEHSWLMNSSFSGTMRLYGHYRMPANDRLLSLVVELPGDFSFFAECETDTAIDDFVDSHLDVVLRATRRLEALGAVRAGLPAPTPLASVLSREWGNSAGLPSRDTSRARLLSPIRVGRTEPITMNLGGGTSYTLDRWRQGAFYNTYSYNPSDHGQDPLRWPCCVEISDGQDEEPVTLCVPGCSTQFDFCSASSPPYMNNWQLRNTMRGGAPDCYRENGTSVSQLEWPAGTTPFGTASEVCYVTFTAEATSTIDAPTVYFERGVLPLWPTQDWQSVLVLDPTNSTIHLGNNSRLHTFMYPLRVSGGMHGGFRIRTDGAAKRQLRIYDFMIYCADWP